MTIKQKPYKEKEADKQRGKRRYRERLVEEKEAKDEIKNYDRGELVPTQEHPSYKGMNGQQQ